MAEEKAAAPAPAVGSAPGGGGSSKLVLIVTLVNVLVSLGTAVALLISFQKDRKKPSVEDIAAQAESGEHGEGKGGEAKGGEGHGGAGEHKQSVDFGRMVQLEQFTINLTTPGSSNPKYARVNISLEVPTQDAESEVTQKMPQIRNTIIDLFNSKRPSDLANAEGREYLKDEIRNALNGFLVTGKVKGVFFTNFAVAG